MLASGSSLEEDRGLVWSVGRKGAAGGAWVDVLRDGRGSARSTKGLGKSTDAARSRPSGDVGPVCSGGTRPATSMASPAPPHRPGSRGRFLMLGIGSTE